MKLKLLVSSIVVFCTAVVAFGQSSESPKLNTAALESEASLYQENKGQVVDTKGEQRSEILFTSFRNGVRTYYKADGISYVFEKHNGLSQKADYSSLKIERNQLSPKDFQNNRDVSATLDSKDHTVEMHRIDLNLIGSNPSPSIVKLGASSVFDNFYLEHCRISEVRSYNKVIYKEVYPFIDMVLYSKDGSLKYDFIVRPGGDPSAIKLKIEGTDKYKLTAEGELLLSSHLGVINEGKPLTLQDGKEVVSSYKLSGDELSFNISNYDKAKTLVIDPTREWGTFYTASGGYSEWSYGQDLSADGTGVLYAINTNASNYPVSAGVYNPTYSGGYDIRIAKFDPAGNLLWGTYIGSASDDMNPAISAGPSSTFVLSGTTNGAFPTTAGTHDQTQNGSNDFFLCQFNTVNGTLNWSTFIGGASDEFQGNGVDVNAAGEIAFVGNTVSNNMPMIGAYDATYNGNKDLFVAKFDNSGNIIWSTYFGSANNETSNRHGIEFDNVGNIVVLGQNYSGGITTTAGVFQPTYNANQDLFLVSFAAAGASLNYSTYIGSAQSDGYACNGCDNGDQMWYSLAMCSDNSVIVGSVTWNTVSNAWAYTTGAYSNAFGGAFDSYIIKFNNSGNRIWGTTWPGNIDDWLLDVAVDGSDNVFVYTGTTSSNLPVTADAHQLVALGGWNKHLALLSSDGSTIIYGTYLGSNDYDMPEVGTISFGSGSLYAGAVSQFGGFNPAWMTSTGAYQTSATGGAYYPVLNKFLFCDVQSSSVVVNETCVGTNDASIDVTSSTTTEGVLTYSWSNGPTVEDQSGLTAGNYTLTITGSVTGCSVDLPFTIEAPVISSSSIVGTDVLCADGTVPNYDRTVVSITYKWLSTSCSGNSNGVFNINGQFAYNPFTPGNCTCVPGIQSTTIVNPVILGYVVDGNNNFTADFSTSQYIAWAKCSILYSDGNSDEIVLIDVNGGGDAISENSDLCVSVYNSYLPVQSIISNIDLLNITPSPYPGNIDLTVAGDLSTSYTYLWNTGATTEDIVATAAGTYTVDISYPGCGIIGSQSVTIGGPSVTAAITSGICGVMTGTSIDVSPVALTAPISYVWSNGATTEDISGIGAGSYSVTVTDASGCPAFVSQAFDVLLDGVPPIATCQDITVSLIAGNATITGSDVDNGSFDACNGISLSPSPSTFTIADLGPNNVTLTVTDDDGNMSTCLSIVTVIPNSPPTMVCQNVTIQAGASCQSSAVAADFDGGIVDPDGDPFTLSVFPVGPYSLGTTNVILTADDGIATATCSATITVIDNVAPIVACLSDITVNNVPNNCGRVVNYAIPAATDNCSVTVTQTDPSGYSAGDLFPVGSTYQEYSYTDVSGNTTTCGFNVIVLDVQAPTITPLTFTDITVNNSPGLCGANVPWLEPTASDNCPGVILTASNTMGSYFPIGTTIVTYTATDASLNTSSLSFNVTVIDNEMPIITCPADIAVNTDAGQCYATVTLGTATATDNCSIVSLTNNAPANFPVGPTTVTWTAIDNQGNIVTCNQLVTVTDNVLPTAICQNISIDLDATGNVSITAAAIDNGSSDACGVTLSASQTDFTCTHVGPNTVTLTVTDANGNVSTCNAIVTVNDFTPPVATCQDVTLQLDIAGNVMLNTNQVDNGSSDACGIASMSLSKSAFTCADVATSPNSVTLTILDINGNSSTCTADITVQDLIAPSTICQNVSVNLDATGNGATTAALVNNGSSDACGIASLTLSQTAFSCADIVSNPHNVILSVLDNNGNTSTCNADVTVIDAVAPTALCQDVTVTLDAAGLGSTTAALVDNGSSDACGIASVTLSQTAFTCAEVGTKVATLSVTDVNGNIGTCTTTITIVDNIAPTALCQNYTAQLDAAGSVTITGAMVNNTSTDACGIASLSVSPATFNCADIGPNPVTLTVTDVNGNAATCTSTVTVEDHIVPAAVCQNITIYLDGTGNASIVAADIDGGSTDACGISTLAASQTAFNCSNIGANTVTLTVTDNNGNVSTCNALVTVLETTPPVAVCQNITVTLDGTGSATILASALDGGSTDNCSALNFAASQTTFDCSNVGTNNVTLTVSDNSGNAAICVAVVTVQDNIAPTAICQNLSVNLNAAGTVTITPSMINNGSFDNCTIASVTASQTTFTCANVGPNSVTLTVTDMNGNVSTCTSTVTVNDNIAPTAICQNTSVNLDAAGNASVTSAMIDNGSYDNCGIASLVAAPTTFTCANVGPNTVTMTVTDVNGNVSTCSSTVTVIDNMAPTALCQNISVNLDVAGNAAITAAMIDNGSIDNCGIASVTASQTAFNCSNVGTNNIILNVLDVNGNTATCTSVVTVIDAIVPVANCKNITVSLDATGNASVTGAMINNVSTDACGIATLIASPSAFTCANVGPNSVTLTVTDVNGNASTCTSTVTVQDIMAPIALCQNATVALDAAGIASVTSAMIDNGSTDNCGIATLIVSPSTFNCSNVGINPIALTVTDVNGNVSTCSASVTIIDNIAPTALCQNATVNLNAAGAATVTNGMINNGSFDNCSIATITVSPTSFNCSNVGPNPVTLTVTDVNGNFSTCTSTVTVQDIMAPTAICQNQTINLDATGNASTTAASINNGSFDNCGIASLVASQTAFTCVEVGANTVTLTVTDVNSNVSTCTSTVTVVDNIAPNAICQNTSVNLDAAGAATITAAIIDNGSNDNCGIASVTVLPTAFTCANVGTNNVTLTVTDVNGNVSTCSATVTVNDNIAPTAICQDVTVNLNAAGNASITTGMINNGSFDNCGISSISASQLNFNCSNVGTNVVTLTVTDVNTNQSTCTSTVTVVDAIAPIAICQNTSVNLDASGNATVTGAMINNASSDACGIASLVASPNAFTCANVGPNTVTLTVTDINGNTATCSSIVTVIDNTAPNAVCQNITVNLDATGNTTITAALIDNGSNDNCGIASISASNTNFTCANVGPNSVLLTVTDINGNVSVCTSTVTVADIVAPIALCQNQTLDLDIFGNVSTTVSALNNGSTDECGIASITASQTVFDCSDLGSNNITLTVTDINGNVSTCTSVVTIQDLIAPAVTTQDITVALDATGNATITGAMITAAVFDNCGVTSIVTPTTTFNCSNIGPNNVTLTVTDASGNSATGTAVVTIVDNMAPSAICQNVTVSLDAAGLASITTAMIDNASSDNCGVASISASQLNFDCSDLGNNNVTLTVLDVNGNSASCLAVVTVNDLIAPVAVCQNVTLTLDSNGDAVLTPAMIENGSSDNCSIAYMAVSQSNFTCVNTGANTVTYTVTDNSGNTATCTATVTVQDIIAPNAICENITVNLDMIGDATITAAMIDNGSNDNCGIASVVASQTAYTCANVGANNVTLTVTDLNGNTSTCSSVVTVVDAIAPLAICQNASVSLDAAGMASITAAMIDNASSDACGIASVTVSPTAFTCTNVGTNNVTLTVTDVNGNSATCSSTVTVVDNIAPTALCQNATASLNPAGTASITAGMINNGSFDNCGIASITASQTVFSCADFGNNNITLSVTDVNGNVNTCVAVVNVIDAIAPVIVSCPSNMTVPADLGSCDAIVSLTGPVATDNCTTTITNNAPAVFPLGTTTVVWTVTDIAGNAVTCAQTITVIDTQAPTIVCPADINTNTDLNICFATGVILGTPITADNCSVASVTNNSPSVFPLGTTIVTWTVTDLAGNTSTCGQTVTVVDNQAPSVACTADITLTTVEGSCGRVVSYSAPIVVDNCSVMGMTQSDNSGYTSGDIFPVGTTVISYTATDGSGNTYTCSFNVTIVDNQSPVLSGCPSDITVSSAPGSCDVAVNWVSPTANDNCPGVQLTTTHTPGSLFGPGSTVVTYEAIDNGGNMTACSFTVTVIDGNAPIVPVLADVYNSCQVNTLPSPMANDICAGEITGTTATIFPITTVGVTPVIWSFNDGNGNISTATQYVYIDGDIDATVSIVNDVTLMANNTNATYQWIDCATGNPIPGATNQTFVATTNGEYAVIITENSCPSETSDCITVKNVGLADINLDDLSIYPNPSVGGVFTINYSGQIDKIEVVDMIGRVIAIESDLVNGKVDGSALAAGKYFVRIYTQGTTISKEVIVITK